MSEPLFSSDDAEQEASNKNVTMLIYILLALSFVTGGLTAIAAVIINYIKRDDVRGSWLEGHFQLANQYLLVWTVMDHTCVFDVGCSSWMVYWSAGDHLAGVSDSQRSNIFE